MLRFRKAKIDDIDLYFRWVNEIRVREQSFNSEIIDFNKHSIWFESKINDENCTMLIFLNLYNQEVGQVRIQKENDKESLIGISICVDHRGRGYSSEMLKMSCDYYLKINPNCNINAYIKETNLFSKYAFEKAGFKFIGMKFYQNYKSFHYIFFYADSGI
jgi:RimJ/RimL family protein N-acetyltransferase